MAKAIRRVARPRPGPEWEVRQVEGRTDWADEVETCACCGASVDLRGPHVGADLIHVDPSVGQKRGMERERYVFCDRTCARTWRTVET